MIEFIEIECADVDAVLEKPNTVLVDVRNKDEVLQGYIKGAIHIPLAYLPSNYQELLQAEQIVFYCHSGVRSAHAAAFMLNQTNTEASIFNLTGGVVAWDKAGFPLSIPEVKS